MREGKVRDRVWFQPSALSTQKRHLGRTKMALEWVRVTRFELVFSTLGKSHVGHYTKPADDTSQYTGCGCDCQGVHMTLGASIFGT